MCGEKTLRNFITCLHVLLIFIACMSIFIVVYGIATNFLERNIVLGVFIPLSFISSITSLILSSKYVDYEIEKYYFSIRVEETIKTETIVATLRTGKTHIAKLY